MEAHWQKSERFSRQDSIDSETVPYMTWGTLLAVPTRAGTRSTMGLEAVVESCMVREHAPERAE